MTLQLNMMVTQREGIAWLAGIVDGEGSINIKKAVLHNPQPRVVIRMTHHETIETAHTILKYNNVGSRISKSHPPSHINTGRQPQYVLESTGYLRVRAYLELILPYLVTKKENAYTLLAYIYSRIIRTRQKRGDKRTLTRREQNLMEHLSYLNSVSSGKRKSKRIPREHTSEWTFDTVYKMCSDLYRDMQSLVETQDRLLEKAILMYENGATIEEISEVSGRSKTWIYNYVNANRKIHKRSEK